MQALALSKDRDDQPVEDHIVLLEGVTWADYERMRDIRGDRSSPRLALRKGQLEIMSPSQSHESIKSIIACLLEVYCLETNIEFSTVGSWTLEAKDLDRAIEPDECYVFGPARNAVRPDLAIEVIWTSGGINKLDIYRALEVREVWIWRRGRLTPWILEDGGYVERTSSRELPELDLEELARFLDRPTTSTAMRDYRDALRARS